MLAIPNSFDSSNVYNNSVTQAAFTTLGGPDVLDLVSKAGNLSLSGAWYQKWLVHRRARPEVYGGRLHRQIKGEKDYGIESYNGNLTIGDEINKLASNIALGRDWAGVHYRSDGVDGLLVGEQQAIGLLQDYSRTYREQFDGFNLTKFDGTSIVINGGELV